MKTSPYEKIYQLTIKMQQESVSPVAIISSYVTPTVEKKVEFFATREGAENRKKEIYETIEKTFGFPLNIIIDIQECNLII